MGMNVAQVLHQGALRTPDRVAVIILDERGQPQQSRTYFEVDRAARRVAHALAQHGVASGDRVALCAGNGLPFIAGYFGALYTAASVVPIPILSAAPEAAHRVTHPRCAVALVDAPREPLLRKAQTEAEVLRIEPLMQHEGAIERPLDREASDTAMVLYTSGTTGQAKGAAISHGALLSHTSVLAFHALRLSAHDRVLGILPLTHSYGCRMVMLASFYAGAACVLLPRFEAATAMEVMVREQITWLPAVPTMFNAFGNLPEHTPQPRLSWAMCAGAPLPDEVARRAEDRLGCEVRQAFGMTEATIATLNAPPDARVLGSVGMPVWGVELRVTDESGHDLAPGTPGEVLVRGHNTMSHYLDDPAATAKAKSDGFMRSGDVGYLDDHGRLFIVDRIKDLIIRGGNNVYPSEVENALAQHPAIAQVAVVGRPHDYYGEEVVAVVILREGHTLSGEALDAFARERVAKTKVPRELAILEHMPLGPSGKVLKRTLRDWLSDGTLKAEPIGKNRSE